MVGPEQLDGEPPTANKSSLLSRLHWIVIQIEPWGILIAVVALVFTVMQFWIDLQDRVSERVVRSWAIITTVASGNSGKIQALEYLNREDGYFCSENPKEGCAIALKARIPLVSRSRNS